MSDTVQASQIFRRLMGYVRPYSARLALAVVLGVVGGGSVLAIFTFLRQNLAHLLNGPVTGFWQTVAMGLGIPLFFLIKGIAAYFAVVLVHWVGYRVVSDLRLAAFSHIQRLPMSFFFAAALGRNHFADCERFHRCAAVGFDRRHRPGQGALRVAGGPGLCGHGVRPRGCALRAGQPAGAAGLHSAGDPAGAEDAQVFAPEPGASGRAAGGVAGKHRGHSHCQNPLRRGGRAQEVLGGK
jgi:hypothetical protein